MAKRKANDWQAKVAICACSPCLEAYLKKCLANDPHITFTNYAPKADVAIAEADLLTPNFLGCPQYATKDDKKMATIVALRFWQKRAK